MVATADPRARASMDEAPIRNRSSRAELLRGGACAAGLALAGVTAVGLPGVVGAAPSPEQDERVLNLLLMVEYAEVGFYEAALRGGTLSGELESFAEIVAEHERAHLAVVREALGSAAEPEPRHDFAAATGDPDAFADAAGRLEDLAVAAYNGQAANVTPKAFAAAARIVSVEARHAAWIRSIGDRPPAPDATDQPKSAAEVREGLRKLGLQL